MFSTCSIFLATRPGETAAIPLLPGKTLPDLPPAEIRSLNDAEVFRGARLKDGTYHPGPILRFYAFAKATVHRNLFRLPLRNQ